MISSHSTNKEVIHKKICYSMRYTVTLALTWIYGIRHIIFIFIHTIIYECSTLHSIVVTHK